MEFVGKPEVRNISSIDLDLNLWTSKALADLQQTFHDTKSFRYEMLRIVEIYLRACPDPVSPDATKLFGRNTYLGQGFRGPTSHKDSNFIAHALS